MVFLISSRAGYESFLSRGSAGSALWVAAGVLSPGELVALREAGANVTNLIYEIAEGDWKAVEGAVATVKEHHPAEVIWVQA
jgi:hypothetical protein